MAKPKKPEVKWVLVERFDGKSRYIVRGHMSVVEANRDALEQNTILKDRGMDDIYRAVVVPESKLGRPKGPWTDE